MAQVPPQRKQHRRLLWLCVLIIAAIVVAFALLRPAASLSAPPPSDALLESARGLDEIDLHVSFDPTRRLLTVTQLFSLTNRDEEARDTLVFRAYPNAFASVETSPIATEELFDGCYPSGFSGGSLTISTVQVGRSSETMKSMQHRYIDEAKTVLSISLPWRWEPQTTVVAEFHYTEILPLAASRFGMCNDMWAVGNAFLQLAPYEDGAYLADPYYAVGDPFISDCANYRAIVTVPVGYACAGSAWPTVTQAGEEQCYTFTAYAVRDFTLCLSNRYQQVQAMVQGVLITAYAVDSGQAAKALHYAKQALVCYTERFGAYPYPSFTLAEVDFPFGGMEYPSMVMISSETLRQGGESLEWVVAHETAHQWWYGVVGNDQVRQAWQDEALCEFSLLDYVETYYGRAQREDMRFSRIETAMRVTIPRGVTPGSPLDYFGSMSEYSLVVYRRGAAMLCALSTAMDEQLDGFLRVYYDDYQFARPTREDFERTLNAFSGEDWSQLIVDYLDTSLAN